MRKLYDNTLARMEKFLPQLPYGGGLMHQLRP
jgi:hypothetical protein